jgi:hypothetical protein
MPHHIHPSPFIIYPPEDIVAQRQIRDTICEPLQVLSA